MSDSDELDFCDRLCLAYVKEQTPRIRTLSVEQDSNALIYVNSEFLDECISMVKIFKK